MPVTLGDFASVFPPEGPPRAFRLMPGVRVPVEQFFHTYARLLGLPDGNAMQRSGGGVDISGCGYARFVQQHDGRRVHGGEMVLAHRDWVLAHARVPRSLIHGTRRAKSRQFAGLKDGATHGIHRGTVIQPERDRA